MQLPKIVLWRTTARAFFFALTVILGALLGLEQLSRGNTPGFIQVTVVVCAVFFIEFVTSWQYYGSPKLTEVDRQTNQNVFWHHLVLPITTYLSIVLFTYFNRNPNLQVILLSLGLFMFTVLFVNIRAHYMHRNSLQKQTNYIYDIIKLVLFFCVTDSLINLSANINPALLLAIPILSTVLMLLISARYERLEMKAIIFAGLLSVFVGLIVFICALWFEINAVQTSLVAFITFYLCLAGLHHYFERDLSLKLALEYVAIVLIALALVQGMNATITL